MKPNQRLICTTEPSYVPTICTTSPADKNRQHFYLGAVRHTMPHHHMHLTALSKHYGHSLWTQFVDTVTAHDISLETNSPFHIKQTSLTRRDKRGKAKRSVHLCLEPHWPERVMKTRAGHAAWQEGSGGSLFPRASLEEKGRQHWLCHEGSFSK